MSWYTNRGTIRTSSILGVEQPVRIGLAGNVTAIQVDDGSVGIRTAADANVALKIAGNVTTTGTVLAGYGGADVGPLVQFTSGGGVGQFPQNVTRVFAGNAANASVRFGTLTSNGGYTDILTVDAATTRVGVNTVAPEAALHVVGDMMVDGLLQSNGSARVLGSNPFRALGGVGNVSNIELTNVSCTPPTVIPCDQFAGATYVPRTGNVYFVSAGYGNVLALNTVTGAWSQFGNVPSTKPVRRQAYVGSVLAANSKIVCVPHNNGNVMIVDALPQTARGTTAMVTNVSYTDSMFVGGVLDPRSGNVFFVPHLANVAARFDPVTETLTNIPVAPPVPGVAYSWAGGALGGDGKVYCAPYQRAEVLVIDPATSNVSYLNVPTFPLLTNKYAGAVTGPDGKVYCVPHNASSVMCIDPFTSVVTSFGNVGTATAKWYGGSLAPDGKIYCAPYTGGNVLVIDTLTKSVSTLVANLANCAGAVLAPGAGYGEWVTHFVPRKYTPAVANGVAFLSNATVGRVSHGMATAPAWLTGANMSKL